MTENKLMPINGETDDADVNWLECISAMETDQGLLYFCDAKFGQCNKLLGKTLEFRANFPEGSHLYSITAYNPFNKVSNRIVNELSNHELLKDLHSLLPNCQVYQNFSYFQRRPYHFERGYTVQIPPNYKITHHNDVIYGLALKYQQAAYFRGRVVENGLTIPCVILVQGEYTEIEEKLVTIQQAPSHPAFLHRANHAVFRDISEVLTMLYQARDHIPVCAELYDIFLENFKPPNKSKHPIITVEGPNSAETAKAVSNLLNASFCDNTPACLKDKRHKYEHSTILLAAFKTVADYLQASHIAKLSEENSVVMYKYWSNTAASLIASEINKGRSNLPPKNHEVYVWPSDLLKPDAVVLLDAKSAKVDRNHRLKLKTSAMKRMKDSHWIAVQGAGSRPTDFISSVVVDKLSNQGIAKMHIMDTLCPAANHQDIHHQEITTTQNSETTDQKQPLNNNQTSEVNTPNVIVDNTASMFNGRPFWW